jgi:16S rRNA processing protein RimM
MEEYLKIGTVISTHALKGEVKVYPTTEDVRRYDDLDKVFIGPQP